MVTGLKVLSFTFICNFNIGDIFQSELSSRYCTSTAVLTVHGFFFRNLLRYHAELSFPHAVQ